MVNKDTCPDCGTKLIINKWGDYVCPNHGIVKQHEEETRGNPSYCG